MSSIDNFSSDLAGLMADIENQFKSLNEVKEALRTQANDVAGDWSDYFASKKAELQAAKDALNRISNIPVSGIPPKLPVSGALSGVPPKVANGG